MPVAEHKLNIFSVVIKVVLLSRHNHVPLEDREWTVPMRLNALKFLTLAHISKYVHFLTNTHDVFLQYFESNGDEIIYSKLSLPDFDFCPSPLDLYCFSF